MAMGSGGINAGDVTYHVGADLSGLQAGIQQSQQMVQGFGDTLIQNSRAIGIGMTAMGAAITAPLALGVSAAGEFGSKMAEVSTLGVKDMDGLTEAVRTAAVEYGQDLVDAAGAAYQAISAGVSEMDAPLVLAEAAKAATAGVSDLTTSIELGTSVTNAFGGEMANVSQVYDSAFIAVKLGVTTFDELAASVGKVSPMFSAAGLSADEMFASIAALTKGGLGTTEAVTGMKGALTAIIKPTSEASALAEELGIDFTAAGLESQGLAGFLDMVAEATGGNIETMAQLFGGVEGLNAVLALTGKQAQSFNAILGEMQTGAGATDEAFQKIKDNDPSFAWEQLNASMQDLKITVGDALLPALGKLVEILKPIVLAIADWTKEHEGLTTAILIGAGALGTFMLAVGPLLIALPGLVILLKGIAALFGAGGIAAGATTTGTAIAGVGTAAATAAGPTGVGALVAALSGVALPVGAGVAIGAELYIIGAAAWEAVKAYTQLNESAGKLYDVDQKYMDSLKSRGVVFDEVFAKSLDHNTRMAYLQQMETDQAAITAAAWFQHYASRSATEKEFANMKALMLNEEVTSREAAVMVIKGYVDDQLKTMIKASAEETDAMLRDLGIRTDEHISALNTISSEEMKTAQNLVMEWGKNSALIVDQEQKQGEMVMSVWARAWQYIQSVFQASNDGLVRLSQDLNNAIMPPLGPQRNAAGGPAYANAPTLVGERGPELFVPRVNGRIMTHTQTAAAMAGGGGGNVTVNMNANIASNMDIDAVAKRLGDQLRQRFTGIGHHADWRRA